MKRWLLHKDRSTLKIFLFLGGLFAVLFITSFIPALYFYLPRDANIYNLIVRSALISFTPIMCIPIIYWLSITKPVFESGKNILLHVLLSVIFSFLFLIIFQLLIFFLLDRVFFLAIGYAKIESILVKQFFSIGSILFFTYWGLVVLLGLEKSYEELGQIKLKSNKIESQLELATLSSLRAQLKPHFLFNTLSMVDQMIANDPDRAKRIIDKLKNLLKTTFDRSGSESCTLGEEVDFIKKYLAIETNRFSDRLKIKYAIAPATKNIRVPRFLLQPLVENALIHGVARTMDTCMITISSKFALGRLFISIEDDGPGMRRQSNRKSKGIGLKNVQQRLLFYYGKGAQLNINPGDIQGFTSQISIPYKYLSTGTEPPKQKTLNPNH